LGFVQHLFQLANIAGRFGLVGYKTGGNFRFKRPFKGVEQFSISDFIACGCNRNPLPLGAMSAIWMVQHDPDLRIVSINGY